ncbi:MAG: hypothetical protein ACRCZ2_09775 [Fusobacteriaceae bacterium]
MYTIDIENRRVIIEGATKNSEPTFINEFDKLEKKFLANTADKYECELVLVDVKNEESGETKTEAFARRVGYEQWLMPFNTEEYK